MSRLHLAAHVTLASERLGRIVRWQSWAYCKMAFLIACLCYGMLAHPDSGTVLLDDTVLLFAVFCCWAACGYAINSYSDTTPDAKANKSNPFSRLSREEAGTLIGTIVVVALAASVLVCIYFWRADIAALVASECALAAAYSLPPVRLKERGILGVLASTLTQHTIPAATVFTAMDAWDGASLSLCGLSTLIGTRFILIHQLKDEQADTASKVRTLVTVYGSNFVRQMLRTCVFPLEVIALAAAIGLLTPAYPAIPVAAGASVLLNFLDGRCSERALPFFKAEAYASLSGLYFFYLPVVMAAYVCMWQASLWLVPAFALVWTRPRLDTEIAMLVRFNRAVRRRWREGKKTRQGLEG